MQCFRKLSVVFFGIVLLVPLLLSRWEPPVPRAFVWVLGPGVLCAVIAMRFSRRASFRRAVQLGVAIVFSVGTLGNLAAFVEIERSDPWRLRSSNPDSLADLLATMPRADVYPGGQVLVWLRRHAPGAVLVAGEQDLASVGLIPFQLLGFSGIKVVLKKTGYRVDSSFESSRSFQLFRMLGVRRPVGIDLRSARPDAVLCAASAGEALLIVDADLVPGCEVGL